MNVGSRLARLRASLKAADKGHTNKDIFESLKSIRWAGEASRVTQQHLRLSDSLATSILKH